MTHLFRGVSTLERAREDFTGCAGSAELESGKRIIIVSPTYFVTPELIKDIDIPQRGILSRTLYDDNDVKVVLFGFSAGHELSAHTAPMPAALYFLEGEADLTLGSDTTAVKAGAFAHMPPYLKPPGHFVAALLMSVEVFVVRESPGPRRPGARSVNVKSR